MLRSRVVWAGLVALILVGSTGGQNAQGQFFSCGLNSGGQVNFAWTKLWQRGCEPERHLFTSFGGISLVWTAQYVDSSGGGSDYAVDVARDVDGNLFVLGQMSTPQSGLDVVTLRLDPSGQVAWQKRFTSPGFGRDVACAIAATDSGPVYVATGVWVPEEGIRGRLLVYTRVGVSTADLVLPARVGEWHIPVCLEVGPEGDAWVLSAALQARQFVLERVTAEGEERWSAQTRFDLSGGWALPRGLAVDEQGRATAVGILNEASGNRLWVVAQFTPQGSLRWQHVLDGPAGAGGEARTVCTLGSGRVAVAGMAYDSRKLGDVWTVCLDSSGRTVWGSRYEGAAGRGDGATAVMAGADGSLYVAGTETAANRRLDMLLLKLDAGGSLVWSRTYDGPAHATDKTVALTPGPTGGVALVGNSVTATGSYQTVVVQFDGSGEQRWGWISDPGHTATAATFVAGPVVVGRSAFTETPADEQIEVTALDTTGQVRFVAQENGPGASNVVATLLSADAQGNTYVTANRAGTAQGFLTVSFSTSGRVRWAENPDANAEVTKAATVARGSRRQQLASMATVQNLARDRLAVAGWTNSEDQGTDLLTLVYDTDGTRLWQAQESFANQAFEAPSDVGVDPFGTVSVVGEYFDVSDYAYRLTLVRYAPTGESLWRVARTDTPSYEPASRTVVSDGQHVYVSGGPVVLASLDSLGAFRWQVDAVDLGFRMFKSAKLLRRGDGRLVTVGWDSGPNARLLICCVNREGAVLWSYIDDRCDADRGSMALMAARRGGGLVVVGPVTVQGDNDHVLSRIVSLSAAGEVEWAFEYENQASEYANAWPAGLVLDRSGNTVVAIYGESDYAEETVLLKFDPLGNPLWEAHNGKGPWVNQRPVGVAVDSSGDVFVAMATTQVGVGGGAITVARYTEATSGVSSERPGKGSLVDPTLFRSYPNPFNATTTITFVLGKRERVTLDIFDLDGRQVARLLNAWLPAGWHRILWDAGKSGSGVYLCRLQCGSRIWTRKLILLK